jgi:hypothetical protein
MNIKKYLTTEVVTQLVKDLVNDGFEKEEIRRGINRVINKFSELPDRFKIYRILKVDNESKIDKENLGVHWTLSKSLLMDQHYYSEGNHCLITAYVTEDKINVIKTVEVNIKYPPEKEILVKNMGKDLEIISIKCGE